VDSIVAEGLEKRYGAVRALTGVTFSVREGEVFGLLGPNGGISFNPKGGRDHSGAALLLVGLRSASGCTVGWPAWWCC
jgi:hypothetical protein